MNITTVNNAGAAAAKPGIRTTEFWGKTLLQLVVILNMLFGLGIEMSEEVALTIVAGLEAIYAVARGAAKRAPNGPLTQQAPPPPIEVHNHLPQPESPGIEFELGDPSPD